MKQQHTQHTVANEDADIRLDRWFKRHYPALTHSMLEKYLRKGLIRLDGKKAKSSERVYSGQVIQMRIQDSGFRIQEERKNSLKAESQKPNPYLDIDDIRMLQASVIYKDANVIVINKPFGLAVQGGTKVNKSVDGLLDALAYDGARPKLVHRLDRDTSGVLVLARNARVAAKLGKEFSGKSIEKTYWALVNGCPLQLAGTIDLPLSKMTGEEGSRELVGIDEEEGKFAITEYRVIDQLARKFALMELKPLTGRTHQLRVHMQAIGCPIVGDHKYGGSTIDAKGLGVENVLHLHARRIVIPGAGGIKKIDVTAPLPKHMVASFKALGLDVPKK